MEELFTRAGNAIKNEDARTVHKLVLDHPALLNHRGTVLSISYIHFNQKVTLVHLAVEYHQFDLTRWLIRAGASIHLRDSQGRSPLDYAMHDPDMVGCLVQFDHHDIRLSPNDYSHISIASLEWLLTLPSVAQNQDQLKNELLGISSAYSRIDMVKYLLGIGARPQVQRSQDMMVGPNEELEALLTTAIQNPNHVFPLITVLTSEQKQNLRNRLFFDRSLTADLLDYL